MAAVSKTTGNITPFKTGKTTITATSLDNPEAKAKFEVEVIIPVSSVSLGIDSRKSLEILIPLGQSADITRQFSVTVLPENATDKTVIWSCTDNEGHKVQIDKDGLLTVDKTAKTQEVTVTVSSKDGKKSDQCTVSIVKETAVTAINFPPATPNTVEMGQTLNLNSYAEVKPDDATNKTLTWSINKTGLATIDATTGVVTPVALSPAGAEGDITVTATATDGSGVSKDFKIRVVAPTVHVTSISLGSDSGKTMSGYIAEGAGNDTFTYTLNATIVPDNADNKGIDWSIEPVNVNPGPDYSVTNGAVSIKTAGLFKVVATSKDGALKDSCYFNITKYSLAFAGDTQKAFGPGATYDFSAKLTVTPSSLKSSVTWELEEALKAVASISSTGYLTVNPTVGSKVNNKALTVKLKVSESLTIKTSINITVNKN
ncbi:MAG: Ig-like domain-containing protein [Bacteroidales bacterium]|nr:Ig-like domain-containing protein [Bacteroidales bacterium]